jgi:hypothetical protein
LVIASLSTFAVGFVWYGKILFGALWQRLAGLSDEEIKKSNMLIVFGLSFILSFIIAFFLSLFTEIAMMIGTSALMAGLLAVMLCIGFVGTTFGINYLFARKPFRLYLIDMGYMIISFFVMGLIIGAWK